MATTKRVQICDPSGAQSEFVNVKLLTHKELVEAVEMGKILPAQLKKEMDRRKKNKAQRRQLKVKQTMILSQPNQKPTEVVIEREVSAVSQEVISLPMKYEEAMKVLDYYSHGRPWWSGKMELYLQYFTEDQFMSKWNKWFTNPGGYQKGTVEYWADFAWRTRRLRDQFLDLMEEPVPDDGTLVTQSSDEPDLEQTSNLAGNSNVTFVEEREVDSDATHINNSTSSRDRLANMAETPWTSLVEMLQRETIVFRGQWTETSSGEILSMGIPVCLVAHSSFIKRVLQTVAFLRSGVELRIQFNGNRFAAGSLVFALLPPMFEDDVSNYNYMQCFNWPHVRIDAAVSNVATLFVPYTHILSHFPQRAGSLESDTICTLGRLVGYVVNPLKVGAGANNILNFTIYARFVNPELHQTTWPIEEFSYSGGVITQAEEGLFKKIVGGGLSTALGAFLSKMTGGLATGIGSILTGLIFDYPRDPMPAAPVVNTAVGPVCYGAGVDHSIRLALTSVSQTETDPSILGSTNGDFSLQTLLQIPSLVEITQWKAMHQPGELLFRMPVTPVWMPGARIKFTGNSECSYSPTMQAYICRAFCYWRGGLKLKMQFVKTEYNNGRVLVCYSPHTNAKQLPAQASLDLLEDMMQANAVIVDIEEQKEIVIDLPYMSPRPWLRCDAFRTDLSFQDDPPQAKDPRITQSYIGESFCGYVSVYVLNRLVSPSNVPQDIDVNYFIYTADDFELAYPTSLAPLNISSFQTGAFGAFEEYPFVLEDPSGVDSANFENQFVILAAFHDGKRLWDQNRLAKDPKSKYWYDYKPTDYIGSVDDEALQWYYTVGVLRKYLDDATGRVPVQARYMSALGGYEDKLPVTQALEEYTTTRTNEPVSIVSTKGRQTCEAAPATVSENAMNLQTILRRYYCIYNSVPLYCLSKYTCVSVPVNPAIVPVLRYPIQPSAEKEGYGEALPIDQIAWFTKLYTYWRGSLRYKFVYDSSMFDVECVHVPTECREFSIRQGIKEIDIQRLMSFASAISVSQVQGSLEVEVPYASPYNQLFIDVHNKFYDLRCQNGTLFFFFRAKQISYYKDVNPMSFSLFRATGDDFVFNVLKTPPLVEEPQCRYGHCKEGQVAWNIRSPESARNLGNRSQKIVLPGGTGIKKLDSMGHHGFCSVKSTPQTMPVTQALEGVKELYNNLTKTASKTAELMEGGKIENILDSLNSTTSKIDAFLSMETASTAKQILTPTTETVHKYALVASEVVLCGSFIHNVRTCLTDPSLPNFVMLGANFGLIVGLTVSETLQSVLLSVVDWVMALPAKFTPEQPQAQALDGATDFLESNCSAVCSVVAVIGTVLYAYVFGVIPSFDKIKAVIKSFFEDEEEIAHPQSLETALGFSLKNAHFAMLGLSALDKVYTKLVEWIQKFIYWLLDRENPEVVLARAACNLKDRVLALISELDELDYEPTFIAALEDPLVHNRFYSLQNEVRELTRLCQESKVDVRVVSLLAECRRRTVTLLKRMEKERCSATTRYDPFVVCIHGETGVGKTKFARKVLEVYKRVMGLKDHHLLYTKTIKDQYWSGYTNQPVVLWDEYGQSKEADKDSIAEFMTLRGDKPVKVNMAALEDKGRDFTSQGIILTTNVPYQDYDAIRDNEAHKRRRHVMIGMQHRQGFNANVLQHANHDQYPNWEHCAFAITENQRNVPIQQDMTMQQVLDYVELEMTHWHNNQMARLAEEVDLELPRGVIVNPEVPAEAIGEYMENALEDIQDALEDDPAFFEDMPFVDANDAVVQAKEVYKVKQKEVKHSQWGPATWFMRDYTVTLTPKEEFEADMFLATVQDAPVSRLRKITAKAFKKVATYTSKLRDLVVKLFDNLKSTVINFWSNNPKLAKVLGITTLLGAVAAVMHFTTKPKDSEAGYENGPVRPQQRRVMPETYESQPKRPSAHKIMPEGTDDPQAFEISRKVSQYVYSLSWDENATRSCHINGIHICGHLLLVPFHFFNHAKEGDFFYLNHRVNPVPVEFHAQNLYRSGEKDWVVYNCGSRLEPAKNLVKFFIDENYLGKIRTSTCLLVTRCHVTKDIFRDNGVTQALQDFAYKDPKWGDVYKQRGWRHNLNTTAGQCGGPLFIFNNALPSPGKIGGIHTAGYTDKPQGYCVLVTRQMLEVAVGNFSKQTEGIPVPQCIERGFHEDLRIVPEGDFSIVGKMPNKLAPAQPIRSTFVKTPFHEAAVAELGPAPKIPAKLKQFTNAEGERVSPLKKAIVKYGNQTIPFSQRNIKKVTNYFIHMFDQKLTHHTGKRIFTVPEAVNGLPGVEFAEKMNMKSSAGWPYQMLNRSPGKWHLFDEQGNIVDAELEKRLNERSSKAAQRQRVESIWRDCMKDELRPVHKVNAGKTRLFTIAPVDFTILTRQMFFDFIMAFYDAHSGDFFSAVGINPESLEWDELYHYFAEYNSEAFAGDYECYDGKIMPELMMAVCDVINAWYGDSEENQNTREVIFEEICHTMQLCENLVYMTHQGNPSGNPLTTILNTIVNCMLLCLAWLELCPDKTLDDFFQNVRVKAYGDDNVVAPKSAVAELYNQNTVAQVFLKHNIVYTTEAKDGHEVSNLRPLYTLTFLKRGFRKDKEFGNFWLPVMSEETLNSYFYYIRESTDEQDQIFDNQRSALTFAGFHGRDYYDKYLRTWQKLCASAGVKSLQISFEEQVDVFKYGAGVLDTKPKLRQPDCDSEGLEEVFMKVTNHKATRTIAGICEAPAYYLAAALGLLSKGQIGEPTDDRWAVAIPSGEGKSYLARHYSWLFVDHDELLLPLFAKQPCRLPWTAEVAREYDFPANDRRILLVHHPSYTKRRIVGSFVTPFPSFIRINCIQRLRLNKPIVMDRNDRNIMLVQLCSTLEPNLKAQHALASAQGVCELACLNQPANLLARAEVLTLRDNSSFNAAC